MTSDVAAVDITRLAKSYGPVAAVAGLDLSIRPSETVALLGPNGAGKSTVISLLLGLTRADLGEVRLFGLPPGPAVRAGRVGAMLQEGMLPWYVTVAELVDLARALYPRPLPRGEILAAAGLSDLAGRRLERLSGGQAQRARFAFALAGDPDLLVLDEPTAGMDVAARHRFWASVRRRAEAGRTVLFATHYLAEADDYADRVVMISHGRVVADGTSAEIRHAVGCRTVGFRLGSGPAGGTAGGLDRLPGVRAVEIRGERAKLTSDDADATVSALIRSRGPVRDLEVTGAGLTEAFLALTGDEDGDRSGEA